jgi:diacylglycerol kinase (ATP)
VRQEAFALAFAVPLAFVVSVGVWQFVALVSVVLLVMAVELLNTSIEKLCDHVTPQIHPTIKIVKDMGSAAVLCALLIAGLVWLAALAERLGFA